MKHIKAHNVGFLAESWFTKPQFGYSEEVSDIVTPIFRDILMKTIGEWFGRREIPSDGDYMDFFWRVGEYSPKSLAGYGAYLYDNILKAIKNLHPEFDVDSNKQDIIKYIRHHINLEERLNAAMEQEIEKRENETHQST